MSSCRVPFIAQNEDVSTVVCAPIYREHLGLSTEVVLGACRWPANGLLDSLRTSWTLMFKSKLTGFVADLPRSRMAELDRSPWGRALGIGQR